MGIKINTLFFDFTEPRQGKHLKSAGVRKNRLVPGHKLVQTSQFLYDFIPGTHMQMVGIGQLYLGSDTL